MWRTHLRDVNIEREAVLRVLGRVGKQLMKRPALYAGVDVAAATRHTKNSACSAMPMLTPRFMTVVRDVSVRGYLINALLLSDMGWR